MNNYDKFAPSEVFLIANSKARLGRFLNNLDIHRNFVSDKNSGWRPRRKGRALDPEGRLYGKGRQRKIAPKKSTPKKWMRFFRKRPL